MIRAEEGGIVKRKGEKSKSREGKNREKKSGNKKVKEKQGEGLWAARSVLVGLVLLNAALTWQTFVEYGLFQAH